MNRLQMTVLAFAMLPTLATSALAVEGNAGRGQRVYRACAACHSLEPRRNMTGPSLSGLWNRKAGSLPSFHRYSPALKSADIVWNEKSLDAWIRNPQKLVPGTSMTFRGIEDNQARADLLAFLEQATKRGTASSAHQRSDSGMGGMMGGGNVLGLKSLAPEGRVQRIIYCSDTYRVTTADGKTHVFWERNLRFKTDSGEDGPKRGAPALVGAGMMGDRADVIFSDPSEIGLFVKEHC